jgi:anti-sigma factor ChrR (cupin superfamily)
MKLPPLPLTKIDDLKKVIENPDSLAWEPFHAGVRISRIYGDGKTGPGAAFVRFEPGGKVPLHEHVGFEHIFILAGSQVDDTGESHAGSLIVNPPGTRHSIFSASGCLVLAIYEKPVRFLTEGEISS